MTKKGEVKINQDACKGCARCVSSCPKKLIKIGVETNSHGLPSAVFEDGEEKCTGCGLCYQVCPDIAIEVYKNYQKEATNG